MLSHPGLAVDAPHIFQGTPLRIFLVFSLARHYCLCTWFSAPWARHVLLFVLCWFGVLHFCPHSSSRSQPGLAPSRSVRPGRWAFASSQPRSQPTLGGFDLGILRRVPRLHIWGSCAFPNGVPLCDGAQHLIVLYRSFSQNHPLPPPAFAFSRRFRARYADALIPARGVDNPAGRLVMFAWSACSEPWVFSFRCLSQECWICQ